MSVRATIESYFIINVGELSKMSASLLKHIESGGKVFITLAGAMSTVEWTTSCTHDSSRSCCCN